MTIAEQLEQKGMEKGMEKGIALGLKQGRSEGMLEAKFEVARTMLKNGLDRHTVMTMTGLTEQDLAQLSH